MENIDLVSPFILQLIKFTLILFMGFYVLFSFVMLRQVKIMTDTLELDYEVSIMFIAWGHLLFSFFILFLALFL